jgi:hypothetical protein
MCSNTNPTNSPPYLTRHVGSPRLDTCRYWSCGLGGQHSYYSEPHPIRLATDNRALDRLPWPPVATPSQLASFAEREEATFRPWLLRGAGSPSSLRSRAIETMPLPSAHSLNILHTTAACSGLISAQRDLAWADRRHPGQISSDESSIPASSDTVSSACGASSVHGCCHQGLRVNACWLSFPDPLDTQDRGLWSAAP